MAPTWQGDTLGCGWHGGQAAHNGGSQVQHPQVCPGGIWPSHDPPEPSQPQSRLCDLQLLVEGDSEPCVHRQPATINFSLVLKRQVGRVLLPVKSVFTLWSGEVAVAAHSPGLKSVTKPLVSDAQSSGVCPRVVVIVVVDAELQMWMKFPLGPMLLQSVSVDSLFRAVSRYLLTPPGCVEVVCVWIKCKRIPLYFV